MQLTATTDYAIRTMCYLAKEKEMRNTKLIAQNLEIPESYVPKVLASLKKAGLVQALEGINGGYSMAKPPEKITLLDIVSATEKTMLISRSLNKRKEDGDVTMSPIHQVYRLLQHETENLLSEITIAKLLGETYSDFKLSVFNVLVDVNRDSYSCGYTYNEKSSIKNFSVSGCYSQMIEQHIMEDVFPADKEKVREFLSLPNLRNTGRDLWENSLQYRSLQDSGYVWMNLSLYYGDLTDGKVFITANNVSTAQRKLAELEASLEKQQREEERYCWEGIAFITSIFLQRSQNLFEHFIRVKHYTKEILSVMKIRYPDARLTDEQVQVISNLSELHDVGKLMISNEILEKGSELSMEEALEIQGHVTLGADMIARMPHLKRRSEWAEMAMNICKYHHERYDGAGYPVGLAGEEIPLCAQAVGLADAYDHLFECKKAECSSGEVVTMIQNGACGGFSGRMIECLIQASKKPNWLPKNNC